MEQQPSRQESSQQQPTEQQSAQPKSVQQNPPKQQLPQQQLSKNSPLLGLMFIIAGVAIAAYSGYLVDSKPAIALAVFGAAIIALTRAVDLIAPSKKLLYTLALDGLAVFIAYLAAAYLP